MRILIPHARKVSRLLVLGFLSTFIVACGQAKVDAHTYSGSWQKHHLNLPNARRIATLDRARNVIWLAACPPSDINTGTMARLVRYDITSAQVANFDSPVPCSGPSLGAPFGLAGSIATDGTGDVWFLAGWKLVRFAASKSTFSNWDIPGKPSIPNTAPRTRAADIASFTYPDALVIGNDGTVWIRVLQVPALQSFAPSTQTWKPLSLGTLVSRQRMGPLVIDNSGKVILGAVTNAVGTGDTDVDSAATLILDDPGTSVPSKSSIRGGEYAITPDGTIAYIDDGGRLMAYSIASGQATAAGFSLKGSSEEDAVHYFRGVQIRIAPDGAAWLLDGPNAAEDGVVNFDRVDLQSHLVITIPLPDVTHNTNAPGYSAPGGAGGLLFDSHGTAWLPTSADSRGDSTELYSLAP